MKKLMFVLPFVALMSCEKEKTVQQLPELQLSSSWSLGLEHNLALDEYYQNHSVLDGTPFEQKVQFAIDYFDDQGADLEEVFSSFPQLTNRIKYIQEETNSLSEGRSYLIELNNSGEYDSLVFSYILAVLSDLELNSSLDTRIAALNSTDSIIQNDVTLSQSEKDMLEGWISICVHSVQYWEVGPQKTAGLPWWEKDVLGGALALSTGLVEYAALATAPWGGIGGWIALGGSAIIASSI